MFVFLFRVFHLLARRQYKHNKLIVNFLFVALFFLALALPLFLSLSPDHASLLWLGRTRRVTNKRIMEPLVLWNGHKQILDTL